MIHKNSKSHKSHIVRSLLAGTSALLLVAGLSLLLSRFQALAQPPTEVTALSVGKRVNTGLAAPGDTLTYTIEIQGPPDMAYDRLWLTDTLPNTVTYVAGSLQPVYGKGEAGHQGGVITWTASSFGFGNFAVITFSVLISPDITSAEIANTAQVTGSGELVQSSAETTVAIESGNLDHGGTRKTVLPVGQVEPGDVLTYTITLSNSSDIPVAAVQVVDRLPPELNLRAASISHTRGSYVTGDDTITWTLDVEGNRGSAYLSLTADVLSYEGWITNTAEISAPGRDPITRTARNYVREGHPQLEASKTVSPSWARPGELLTYTVSIRNTGDGDAETVWMTDRLPSLVTYYTSSLTATMGTFGEAGGVITWNATLGPAGTLLLPDGEEATITFTVRISPELSQNVHFTNTAEITGAGSLVLARADARVRSSFSLYLPLIIRRWPPIPYKTVLYDIGDLPEGLNDYTVRWSHDHDDVTVISYTLQEATDAAFTGGVVNYTVFQSGTETEHEQSFADKPDGWYYYRVQAHNEYGTGAWSDVRSVRVFTVYYDDFSDTSSGWPDDKGPIKDQSGTLHGYWYRGYWGGDYRLYVEDATCRTCDWFRQPQALSPYRPATDTYCVETRMKFETGKYWANMGLIFAADEGGYTMYALCLSHDSGDDLGVFLAKQDNYWDGMYGCAKNNFKDGGLGRSGVDRDSWHTVKVTVDGDFIHVYVAGNDKGWRQIDGLSAMTRIGVVGGDGEIPPADIRYQYFKVSPNVTCTP